MRGRARAPGRYRPSRAVRAGERGGHWRVVWGGGRDCPHEFGRRVGAGETVCGACGARLLYDALPKQDRLHASRARNVLYGGAAGGAKSHGLRWHGILLCLSVRDARVLLLRREYEELRRTQVLKLLEELPLELADHQKVERTFYFPATGSRLFLGHCHSAEDFRKHLSTEWDMILVDESGEFAPEQLRLLQSRLRTTKPGIRPQFVLASNPGGEAHEYHLRWYIEKSVSGEEDPAYDPADYEFVPATYKENPFIDSREYERRLMQLPEFDRKRFLGDWTVAPDRAFWMFRQDVHVYADGAIAEQPWWPCFRAMDWGYAAPTSVGWYVVDDEANVYRVQELYAPELDPWQLVSRVRELDERLCAVRRERALRLGLKDLEPTKPERTYVDPAIFGYRTALRTGPTVAEQLREAGWPGEFVPADNQRLAGWARVRSYLEPSTRPLLRLHESCRAAVRALSVLRRHDRDPDELAARQEDHAADELRYALMSRPEPAWRPAPNPEDNFPHGSAEWLETRRIRELGRKPRELAVHPIFGVYF